MNKIFLLLLAPLLLLVPAAQMRTVNLATLSAPAGERLATNNLPSPVLPNGRLLTPRGRHVKVAAHPFGLALSPDERTLVASCNGTEPFAVSIITELHSNQPQLAQIIADRERQRGQKIRDEEDEEFRSVFMGLAIAPDNRLLFAASGNQGSVFVFDLVERRRLATISLNDAQHQDSFSGALVMTRDGRRLFVLDQANYRVVVIDTTKRAVIGSAPAGRAPFGIALAPDERLLYVTNVGVFRYSLVEGWNPQDPKNTGLTFPLFAYLSEEMRRGAIVEGKRVPGLGDPNDDAAASVWSYEIGNDGSLRLVTKTKTGRLIGETANGLSVIGGSSPSGVVAGRRRVFVSNTNNDSVTVIDATNHRVTATIELNIFNEMFSRWRKQGLRISAEQELTLKRLRGQIPFGMALSSDERRLYVAEAGINAIAVIDTERARVLGHIPTAWFPSQLALSRDNKHLYVANAKGFGSGPNGGPNFKRGPEGTAVAALQKGVISLLRIPSDNTLAAETAQVIRNNGFDLSTTRPDASIVPSEFGKTSEQIRYIVFITKENRTYDQVYGDIERDATGRRLNAEPSLTHYGERSNVYDRNDNIAFREVNVTPNHHALARRFAFADNFYLDADVSADGHRWLVGVYPNAWVETSMAASYGGHRDFRASQQAPGRLTFAGSAAALAPEDYLEAGSVWEHLHRARIPFRNYGEGFELAGIEEEADYEPTGARLPVNFPLPQPLFEATARDFPTFNMNISDQYRWQQFERDFRSRFSSGREPLPNFINLYLPNDHTARERPEDGYPYRASFVADNDLALGRVVEFLSHTQYWREMAIIVTEDDAQDGLDSVDAHRSLLLVISPYARRGYALSAHTSIASIFKTIYLLLGAQPLNQYDAAASDLREAFTGKPDFTPYKSLPIDARIFDEAKSLRSKSAGSRDATRLDDPADFIESHRRLAKQSGR
jgi:YVTN family beta-propeller protein